MWLCNAPINVYQQWERLVLSRAASSQTYCTSFRVPSLSWNPLHRMREKSQIDPSLNKSCYYPPPRHRNSARGHEEVPKPSYCFLVPAELCLLRLLEREGIRPNSVSLSGTQQYLACFDIEPFHNTCGTADEISNLEGESLLGHRRRHIVLI